MDSAHKVNDVLAGCQRKGVSERECHQNSSVFITSSFITCILPPKSECASDLMKEDFVANMLSKGETVMRLFGIDPDQLSSKVEPATVEFVSR